MLSTEADDAPQRTRFSAAGWIVGREVSGDRLVRIVVAVLAILAALKFWTSDWLYRSGLEEAVSAAYLAEARAACQLRPETDARGMPFVVGTLDWQQTTDVEILTGNARLDVAIWQVDNALWNQRYRNPVIRLSVGDALSKVVCDYDVIARRADIAAL